MRSISEIVKKIKSNKDKGLENSFYSNLEDLIDLVASEGRDLGIEVQISPKKKTCGFPDIQILDKASGNTLGFIEVKLPGDDLSENGRHKLQFSKYKESSQSLIITDIINWQLWQWDESLISKKRLEAKWDFEKHPNEYSGIRKMLEIFVEKQPIVAEDPEELAKVLALRNKRLAEVVEEIFNGSDCPKNLAGLFLTIKDYLIKDIDAHDYVNMFAETITYSLFIARLQHFKNGEREDFNIDSALSFLRRRLPQVPLLDELYFKANTNLLDRVKVEIGQIVQDLKLSNIKKIDEIFTKHTPDKDPIIYFYEPFLKYNDPETKMKRGVFYTPKPIAKFITKSINSILKDKKHFGLEDGLADSQVHLLDPAVGTGTFILSAIEDMCEDIKEKFQGHNEEYIGRKIHHLIQEHILERFYGFEIMMAPYAIAHLKLSILLEELGYDFSSEDKNRQFKIYLTNTLENSPHQQSSIFGQISDESKAALKIKNEDPVIVITGNPPYSNFGQMNANDWIKNLLVDYKKGLNERKINLDDDYIKFIRFAQWKLKQVGQGVFAMITNNSFIDGITHRQMRHSLMDTFDEIYIYNLHGNSRKGEITPGGEKDENVFDIQQGVSINFFVKYSKKQNNTIVKYCDLWGLRAHKLETLLNVNFDKIKWQTLDAKDFDHKFRQTLWGKSFGSDLNFFIPKESGMMIEYGNFWGVTEIFNHCNSGIQTKRDHLTIQFSGDALKRIIKDFESLQAEEIRAKYSLPADGRDWTIKAAKEDLSQNNPKITEILYRPFDVRKTIFTGKTKGFIAYPRKETMRQMIENKNVGLITCRNQDFESIAFVSTSMIDLRTYSNPGSIGTDYLMPLYLYPELNQSNLLEQEGYISNLSSVFTKAFSDILGLDLVSYGGGDLEKTFGPEDIFNYIYGVFYSESYRKKYKDLLQIDFPRIPLTSNKKVFKEIVAHGKYLVDLHLLGKNPLAKSITSILNHPSQWHVKIGGDLTNSRVEMVKYEPAEKKVYINNKTYFDGVESDTWDFCIGGYQVLDKWLSTRKGRELNDEEIDHFMKIVVALRETIKTMETLNPYAINVIQENMYINFIEECRRKEGVHAKEVFWKSKEEEERRDIAQGFGVYKGGNPDMAQEDVEFIKRLMLLTKDPSSWLQNRHPA